MHHHHIVHPSTTHPPFILRLADGGLRLETSFAFRRTTIYLRRPSLLRCKRARERAREVEKRRGAEKNRFCRWQLSPELLLLCKQAIGSGTPVCDLFEWSKSFPLKSWCFGLMSFCAPIASGSRVTTNGKWTVDFIAEVFMIFFLAFWVGIWVEFFFFFLAQLPQNWGNSYPFGWVGGWSI